MYPPFSCERAIMRAELPEGKEAPELLPEIEILREVTGDPAYKTAAWPESRSCKQSA